jgi:hypothetical protein
MVSKKDLFKPNTQIIGTAIPTIQSELISQNTTNILDNTNKKLSCRDLETSQQVEATVIEDDTEQASTVNVSENIQSGLIGRRAAGIGSIISANVSTIQDIVQNNSNALPTLTVIEPTLPVIPNTINASDTQETGDYNDTSRGDFLSGPFLGLGRKAVITDAENYVDSLQKAINGYNVESSRISDRIKYHNGSFYVLDKGSLKLYKNIQETKKNIKLASISSQIQKGVTFSPSIETHLFDFDSLSTPDNNKKSSLKNSFINGRSFTGIISGQNKNNFTFQNIIEPQENIVDNTFEMQLPFENSELLDTLNLVGTSIVNIKEHYNFYIEQYEKIADVRNTDSKENVFPNLYLLNAILEDKTTDSSFLKSVASLNRRIKAGDKFMLNKSQKVIFGIKDGIGEYFDIFGKQYNNLKAQENLHKSFDEKMNNIIFLSDATNKMEEINKKKYLFPMTVDISIPTDKTTNITRMLLESEMMDSFLLQLFNIYDKNEFDQRKNTLVTEAIFSQKIEPNTQNKIETSFVTQRRSYNFENIDSLLGKIKQSPISPSGKNYVVIGNAEKYLRTNTQSMSFVNGLRNIIFKSKLDTFVRNNHRSYNDILEGKTCYNETVAFRISKYNQNDREPIQSYWIPNNPDLDFINIVDTQIKYEKEYIYKIFAYQIVLGNKITQSVATTSPQSDTQFAINVSNLPQVNLMEVEILSANSVVLDTPPLSPEILFVPYFDVDNKIGLFLNSRTGQEKLEPINILATDEEKTVTYTRNLDNSVLYKSDDVAKRFEIMKLEKAPNSYADFANGFIKAVNTDVDPETTQKATAASFIDLIEPNKKYYYCFRTVDVHEKISNPTQIFELQIVNEKGMVYPIIKNYDFEKPAYSNNINIRRFIKIKPSSQHVFLNSAQSNIGNDTTAEDSLSKIKLGVSDVAVPWGKTFKMVVTSKQTGKKCEFKFRFKYILE